MRNIENESVRSDRTDRSDRERNRGHRSHSREGKSSHRNHENPNRDHHQKRHTRRSRSGDGRSRDDRSVTINAPSGDEAIEEGSRYGGRHGPYNNNAGIEVAILPQNEDRWETATAVTDATSAYTGYSLEDLTKIEKPNLIGSECGRWVAPTLASIISLVSFLSPVAMVLLPKLTVIPGFFNQTLQACGMDMTRCESRLTTEEQNAFFLMQCRPECEGLIISLAFKLFILLLGAWACFFRVPKASLPRIFMFRALVLFLVFVLTFSFWLFYGVRIIQDRYHDYHKIVSFAVSLVDALLFVHYLAVILLEIRHLSPKYIVKVSRSPDGETRTITMGELSIQRAAVHCLEQYYKEFPTYNPFLENLPGVRGGGGAGAAKGKNSTNASKFKVYSLDGDSKGDLSAQTAAITAINSRRSDRGGHNDRFYEELEYERRVRKRKARLILAAEDAFTHIRRLGQRENAGPAIPMDPHEAAQAIFPSMARALQKFLRITRQQPWHTMDSVLRHLATCIQHDMTPKAFLQRYFKEASVLHQSDKSVLPTEQWVLVCDHVLSRTCEDGIQFQLKQADVSLLCQVKKIPHISLLEEVVDPKKNRFVLRLNSETSV